MAKNIILVAGSPGAGKTTVLNGVSASFDSKVVNLGTMMLQTAQKLGYVKDRDQLRFMSPKNVTDVRNRSIEEIEKMDGNIIIDTHASIGENGRYLPGLPIRFLEHLGHVKGLVYIDATTKEIMARRTKDKTRKREQDDEQTIDAQRLINLSTLAFASAYLNVPLYLVINKEGDTQKAIDEIKRRLKEVVGG